jgi:hypothetical protein
MPGNTELWRKFQLQNFEVFQHNKPEADLGGVRLLTIIDSV